MLHGGLSHATQDVADIEQARAGGNTTLKVSSATGNTWSGQMGKPPEEIVRELNDAAFRNMNDAWDSELGFKLRAVPVKADALWVAKLEKETYLKLMVVAGLIHLYFLLSLYLTHPSIIYVLTEHEP